MANSSINLTSLDFDTLKTNLKTYLKSQSSFKDYDYEGSNMNVLLDVLAYNTYLNSFYLNMVASESFLDSAQLRNSVVSHAKELNYTPSSAQSSEALVNLTFNTTGITSGTFIIPKGASFSGTNSNGAFIFTTDRVYTSTSTTNTFSFSNVAIYEGTYINESYIVDYTVENQRFIMSNPTIDTSSIAVTVSENNSNTVTLFTQATNLYGLTPISAVYFLQAAQNNQYEIVFGDGVFGREPLNNSVVTVTYRVTNGSAGGGVSTFFLDQDLGAYNGGSATSIISTVSNSSNGSDIETIDSIRFRAPRAYQTQDRAVTVSDYKTLILDNFNDIEDVNVYGGDELPVPQYGTVYVSPSTFSGAALSNQRKTDLLDFLKNKKVINITNQIIDPEYVYIVPTVNVSVNFRSTSLSATAIQTAVLGSISAFNNTYLKIFSTTFRYSKFLESIDNTSTSIVGNLTNLNIYKLLEPTIGVAVSLSTTFGNQIIPQSITSSNFLLIDGNTYNITDNNVNITYDPNNKISIGNLWLNKISTTNTNQYTSIGTVNYITGTVSVQNVNVIDFLGTAGIKINAQTTYNDIVGSLNNIVEIDLASASVTVTSV
jgi:hypothetical protein